MGSEARSGDHDDPYAEYEADDARDDDDGEEEDDEDDWTQSR